MTNASLSRRPFYVHIATLFILLFSLLGGALIVLQFQQGMQQGLEHERQSFQQYREQLALAIKLNQRPARMSLNLLRSGQLSAMTGLETRLAFLPQLAEVLANSTSYGAIYAGYEDGDFFLVRKLTERARGALEAPPPESRLLVQSLHQGQGEFLYFDQRLRLLERRPMPDYRFDPRDRGWYKEARWSTGIIVTHPYLFFTTREPGMTLAVESDDRRAVIGLDAGVEGLSSLIGELPLPGHSQLVLFDEVGTLLATDPERLPSFEQLSRLPMLSALNHPILTRLQQEMAARPALLHHPAELTLATVQGQEWLVNLSSLGEESPFYLALLVPTEVLTAPARQDALHNLAWALAGLLLLLPVIWLAARRTAAPLLVLTGEAERIQHFDFGESPGPDSAIREIDDLARAMSSMRLTLGNFMNMGRALAAEHRFDSLLSRILHETVAAAQAEGGCLFLAQESEMQAVHAIWQGQPLACEQVQWQAALLGGLYHTERLCLPLDEAQWARYLSDWGPFPGACQLLVEPLHNHRQELIGCLLLILPDCSARELASRISLIEALAGTSSSAIENQRLLEEQKQLLEAFIELIAGAIDAKSPYTGGHCQRVPELARMLTQAACAQQTGPFADFRLNEEEWEAIHIASWLHDCGKVTTPEFVVDKATKLETIYDRIHEIRTRFEVLKRDAHIETLCGPHPDSRPPSRPCSPSGTPWIRSSPSWPSAIWGASGWRRRNSPGWMPSPAAPGCALWTIGSASVRRSASATRRHPLPSPAESRCSPTRRSISSLAPSTTISHDTTHGASRCGCPPTSTTGGNATTSPSAVAPSPKRSATRSTITSSRPYACWRSSPSPAICARCRRLRGAITSGWTARAIRASCKGDR